MKLTGFSLVEIIISSAIFLIIIAALAGSLIYSQQSLSQAGSRSRAVLIAEEGLEIVRAIRDEGYDDLQDGTHGVAISSPGGFETGYQVCGSASQVDGPGTDVWFSEPDACVSDDQYASVSSTSQGSDYLHVQNFGFSIPAGASITGITARVEHSASSPNCVQDWDVRILKNGVQGAENKAIIQDWSTTDTAVEYGSSGDLWAETWTPADINSSGFGLALTAVLSTPCIVQAQIDNVEMKVAYNLSNDFWEFSGSNNTIGIFDRTIEIGTEDSKHKIVTSTVTWMQDLQRQGVVQLVTRFTNWLETFVTSWANPGQTGTYNASGNQDGIKIVTSGSYAYMLRDDGTPDFLIFEISNPSAPTLAGSLALPGIPTDLRVSGNYVYVANRSNTAELQVINISNPAAPFVAASLNLTGNEDALSIEISGTYAYVGRVATAGNEIFSINISTPNAPVVVGSVSSNETIVDIYISGTTLYATTPGIELEVFNIANPAAMSSIGVLDLSGTSDGRAISGTGSYVFVGRANGSVAAINVSTPSSPSLISTFNAVDAVNDLAMHVGGTLMFAATDDNSLEFQVINISNINAMTREGSLNLSGDINGVAFNGILEAVVVAGESNSQEFRVIQPQ